MNRNIKTLNEKDEEELKLAYNVFDKGTLLIINNC